MAEGPGKSFLSVQGDRKGKETLVRMCTCVLIYSKPKYTIGVCVCVRAVLPIGQTSAWDDLPRTHPRPKTGLSEKH